AGWAVPHRLVYRLSEAATSGVLAGLAPSPGMRLVQAPYVGYAGGGITVLPRSTYDQVPLDPRFRGWGQEDESWAHALTVLAGDPCCFTTSGSRRSAVCRAGGGRRREGR